MRGSFNTLVVYILKGFSSRVCEGLPQVRMRRMLTSHFLGSAMSSSIFLIRRSRFSPFAVSLNRSMACSNLVSLWSNCDSAAIRSASSMLASLMRRVSCALHASSSLYRISKSSNFRGCMRLSTSFLCLSSASTRACASSSQIRRFRSSSRSRMSWARHLARYPLQ